MHYAMTFCLIILYFNIHCIPQTDALKRLVFKRDSSLQLLNVLAKHFIKLDLYENMPMQYAASFEG